MPAVFTAVNNVDSSADMPSLHIFSLDNPFLTFLLVFVMLAEKFVLNIFAGKSLPGLSGTFRPHLGSFYNSTLVISLLHNPCVNATRPPGYSNRISLLHL